MTGRMIVRYLVILILILFVPFTLYAAIIDNGGNGTSYTGDWKASGGVDYYGSGSLYSKTVGARYTFEAAVNGTHEISIWWTEWPSRSTVVPIEIYDGDALLDTVLVNQMVQGGQWNMIGSHDFNGIAKVVIISEGTTSSTCADAVRFEEQELFTVAIRLTWEWDHPGYEDLIGFTIRINETTFIDIPDPEVRSWEGDMVFVSGPNLINMQAYTDNLWSTWSKPVYYTPIEGSVPTPTGLTVMVIRIN